MNRLRIFFRFFIYIFAFIGLPAHAVDLSVDTIEVTQATQTAPGNDIQLITQRSTAVRVTLGVADSGVPVAGVTGILRVSVGGSEITPVAGLASINAPFTAPLAPDRTNENDTLNFELPTPSGITASNNVDFEVTILAPGDTNPANDVGTEANLAFEDRATPLLFFTRINYTPSGLGVPALNLVEPGVGDAFVRGIYPVNESDPLLYQEGLFPTLSFSADEDNDGILEGCGTAPMDADKLLSFLESCRQLIIDNGVGTSDQIFLYAWLAGNPIAGNGCAPIGGRVGYGNTQETRHQRTFAHELGHNFGFQHSDGGLIDEVGWDVQARLDGNPAGNNTTGRVKPTTLNDIMSGGLLTNQAWIKTANYNDLLNDAVLEPDAGGEGGDLATGVLVVQGIFDPTGSDLMQLDPAFRFPWFSEPDPSEIEPGITPIPDILTAAQSSQETNRQIQAGPCSFSVEVIDSSQNFIITEATSEVGDDADAEACGFFSVMVPVDSNAQAEQLQIRSQAGNIVGSLTRTAASPSVEILEPQPGATLGPATTVRWVAEDTDSAPDDLMFQVAYSPDDGNSFVPIGVDLQETELIFDASQVVQSQGTGLIRVFASDGLNTSFTDLRLLSTDGISVVACDPNTPGAIIGTQGNDRLIGTPGDDVIIGLEGNDTIAGRGGNDCIAGGPGNDTITSRDGDDEIDGGIGNDRINAGNGANTIIGGEGNDSIESGVGDDEIDGGIGNDRISAGNGANTIIGGEGNDNIESGSGNDTINGGEGNDNIESGAGNDEIDGGSENDRLIGGSGTDNCVNGEVVGSCNP